jgi:two-component system sensor kinase FixL
MMYPLVPDGVNIKYFLEIARDVTEYRHLILRAQRSEKRFRAILDTATDAIISVDKDHRIILFNNAAQEIFGYTTLEVLGKDLNIIIPERYKSHSNYLKMFFESEKSEMIGKTISLSGIRKSGEEFPIELSLSFLDMGGEITFTAIIRDVTENQKMEHRMLQSERLAAVGKAVAHVAHEIKNPLMIIGGFSNQIKMNLEDEKDAGKLDMVLDEVTRLERMVANLGDFTKEYRLVRRPSDINSVIKDVIQIMNGVYPSEKYRFMDQLSSNIKTINCDPDKLKQVLINIISNSIEAMKKGGKISIFTEKIDRGVEIRIIDEGIGIPKEELQHIFEPFYTTREKGSGLGLSISYKLIEAHNGEIWADSKPGKGTTFFIQLPS